MPMATVALSPAHLLHVPGACGLDEAGRGPLAGPVVVGAVILPEGFDLEGIQDSKQLSRAQRETQAARIRESAQFWVELAEPAEIDRLNILWASMAAMRRAFVALGGTPSRVLVDGDRCPHEVPGEAVVKGDGIYACIAAASILAKTTRDQLMRDYDEVYPGYGFAEHFGYPTPTHLAALREFGPCPIHRRSYGPVRAITEQPCLDLGV